MDTTNQTNKNRYLKPGTKVVSNVDGEAGKVVEICTRRRNGDAASYVVDTAYGRETWEVHDLFVPASEATPTPATPAATTTAHDTYQARTNDIARLIDVLQMELQKHAAKASAEPKRWDLPGDLGKVRSDLIDTVSFMSGMDRNEVEAFLADAK